MRVLLQEGHIEYRNDSDRPHGKRQFIVFRAQVHADFYKGYANVTQYNMQI